MASLLAALPAPSKHHVLPTAPAAPPAPAQTMQAFEPPPYLKRRNFVPRRPEDFGGGGAFPEIAVAQYPLDMGRPDAPRSNQTLAVSMNAEGHVAFDSLLAQGSNKNKIIHADHKALVPKLDRMTKEALAKPDDEEVKKTIAETQAALERVVQNKLSAANPATLPSQPGGPQYIKYTPTQQGPAYASGAGQRIIKMQDMPIDPLEPPKFRHTKVPRGPGSPPVPVMHSPPRPVTALDQANWKIPPCISNWKNAKGYTIPLDKRLASDGRGLQQTQVNDKFAGFSEALFMAEAKAREAITMRAAVQKELLMKEKAKKEAELRELATKARLERGGGIASRVDPSYAPPAAAPMAGMPPSSLPGPPPLPSRPRVAAVSDSEDEEAAEEGEVPGGGAAGLPPPPPRGFQGEHPAGGREEVRETAAEREERRKRDEIREDRRRERERERRLESKEAHGSKKSKLTRDRDRDISEKVALGMAKVNTGEVMYDQRLFNQDQGMSSGFGADDSYSLYDKALFADRSAVGGLHRPKPVDDDEDDRGGRGGDDRGGRGGEDRGIRTDKFKADKGFKGAEVSAGPRAGPVEFERPPAEEADPFGLDAFLTDVKKGAKGRALDGIGSSGGMKAAGGGSSYDEQTAGGSGRRMQFTSGRN
ncbi:SKIP/SNW domain-containing protein [Haematococcus lacustris]